MPSLVACDHCGKSVSEEAIVKAAGKHVCPRCVEIVTRAAEAERLKADTELIVEVSSQRRREREAQEQKGRQWQENRQRMLATDEDAISVAGLTPANPLNERALQDEDVRQFVGAAWWVVLFTLISAVLFVIAGVVVLIVILANASETTSTATAVGVAVSVLLAVVGFVQWNVAVWFTKFSLLFGRNVIANEGSRRAVESRE